MNIKNFDGELSYGALPKKGNEVVLSGTEEDGSFGDNPESLIGKSYSVTTDDGVERKLKVTGIVIKQTSGDTGLGVTTENNEIYFTDGMISEMRKGLYASNSTTTLLINGKEQRISVGQGGLMPNENVPEGYILLPTSYDSSFKEGYAAGKETKLKVKALYYEYFLDLVIMGTYGEKTFETKTGLKDLSEHDGEIYINPTDYRRMYEKGSFQASVFIDDTKNMEGMTDMLKRGGYNTLVLKDHIYNYMDVDILSILQLPLAVVICIAVFFIAYFVIRLILKSRGVYFATVRMLGMRRAAAGRIMRVELVIVCLIAYVAFCTFVYLTRNGTINFASLLEHVEYLTLRDYLVLAIILILMTVLISGRFMRSIFKSSAMGAYREEA